MSWVKGRLSFHAPAVKRTRRKTSTLVEASAPGGIIAASRFGTLP